MVSVSSLIAEIRLAVEALESLDIECTVFDGELCLITEDAPSDLSPGSKCEVQVGPWLTLNLPVEELHAVLYHRPGISANGVFLLGRKAYIRLEPISKAAFGLCLVPSGYLAAESKAVLPEVLLKLSSHPIRWKSGFVTARISQEPSPLNLALALSDYNDDYNLPHVEEVCLELSFPETPVEDEILLLVSAYLYQLSLRGFDFKPSGPPPLFNELQEFSLPALTGNRLEVAAFLMEESIQPLLQYYAKGVSRHNDEDYETAFLNFYKVLEHAAGVITLRVMRAWISEGDRTVRSVNDMKNDLADGAIVKQLLDSVGVPSSVQLEANRLIVSGTKPLHKILSSTRNYYSHAKAGYPLVGCEFLEPQVKAGSELIRNVAERVIAWYAALPESDKLK